MFRVSWRNVLGLGIYDFWLLSFALEGYLLESSKGSIGLYFILPHSLTLLLIGVFPKLIDNKSVKVGVFITSLLTILYPYLVKVFNVMPLMVLIGISSAFVLLFIIDVISQGERPLLVSALGLVLGNLILVFFSLLSVFFGLRKEVLLLFLGACLFFFLSFLFKTKISFLSGKNNKNYSLKFPIILFFLYFLLGNSYLYYVEKFSPLFFLGLDNLIYIAAVVLGYLLFKGEINRLFMASLISLAFLTPVLKFVSFKSLGIIPIQISAGFADLLSLSLVVKERNISYSAIVFGLILAGMSLGIPIRSSLDLQDFLSTYGTPIFALMFFILSSLGALKEEKVDTLDFKLKRLGIPKEVFSKRELEVLEKIFEGKKQEQIAKELKISVSTVKTYTGRIYKKLGVSNKRELLKLLKS